PARAVERSRLLARAKRAAAVFPRPSRLGEAELHQRPLLRRVAYIARASVSELSRLPRHLARLAQRHGAKPARSRVSAAPRWRRWIPLDLVAAAILDHRRREPRAGFPGAGTDRRFVSASRGEANAARPEVGRSVLSDRFVFRRPRPSAGEQQSGGARL